MNKTRVGGLAAGMFAVGLLTGSAGTAVARDAASTSDCAADMAEHMAGQDMTDMLSMMGGSMMGGAAHSFMPGAQHECVHPQVSPKGAE